MMADGGSAYPKDNPPSAGEKEEWDRDCSNPSILLGQGHFMTWRKILVFAKHIHHSFIIGQFDNVVPAMAIFLVSFLTDAK